MSFEPNSVHDTSSTELEELAATFALEALPADEQEDYRRHLRVCGICRQLTGQFQAVASLLPESLSEESAPSELKKRILTQARKDLTTKARGVTRDLDKEKRASWRQLWSGWMTPRRLGAAIAAVLIVGLVVWNIVLQLNFQTQQDRLSEQAQLVSALTAGAKVFQIAGTEAAPDASATLLQVPNEIESFLLVRNLPQLPSGREYQIWRITAGSPASAGTFARTDAEQQLIQVKADFLAADAIGISVEPKGGSPTPTGAIVLLGVLK